MCLDVLNVIKGSSFNNNNKDHKENKSDHTIPVFRPQNIPGSHTTQSNVIKYMKENSGNC